MRVSYSWLSEYVDFSVPPEELAHRLTMAGIAVENVTSPEVKFKGVIVGKIEHIKPHPHAERLVICTLVTGAVTDPLSVVTGAPNVEVGRKVAFAGEGAVLPGGRIKLMHFGDVKSEGMLCSAEELGLEADLFPSDQKDGIIILPEDAPLGKDLVQVLGLNDAVLELELTPNRADCLAVINIAREVAAVCRSKIMLPYIEVKESNHKAAQDLVKVEIEDPMLCGRYAARLITDIRVGPSPLWLQRRLQSVGVRPINNIVDVTNYVMMELGQPLHAFDYHTVKNGQIVVRQAREGETIVTLDGTRRALEPGMLVIADETKPIAIAGVMGGEETEITEKTTTVLLEAANFDQTSIRRTSRGLGLRTEASIRFERGVDIENTVTAANRAAQLISQLNAGKVLAGCVDCYPRPPKPVRIDLRVRRINEILGTTLDRTEVEEVFKRLDFEYRLVSEHRLEVVVPSYRTDISREIDLVEEVARLYGYDQIPITLPRGVTVQALKTEDRQLEDFCRHFLSKIGLTEIITYSFFDPGHFDRLRLSGDHPWRKTVKLQNPLSEAQSVMRTTLLPEILEVASRNAKHKGENISIFECGRVFIPLSDQKLPREDLQIAGLVAGEYSSGWKWEPVPLDIFFLKGILQSLFRETGLNNFEFLPSQYYNFLHPGRTAKVLLDNEVLAVLGEVHPFLREEYELLEGTCVFWVDFMILKKHYNSLRTFKPIPKYPGASRDLAIVVPEEVSALEIEKSICEVGGEILQRVELFDVYRGKQIPAGQKSMAYSLLYQSAERTLKEEEINSLHRLIQKNLAERFHAELR